jgi:hypothetical protein
MTVAAKAKKGMASMSTKLFNPAIVKPTTAICEASLHDCANVFFLIMDISSAYQDRQSAASQTPEIPLNGAAVRMPQHFRQRAS